jgi:hypothetical protein
MRERGLLMMRIGKHTTIFGKNVPHNPKKRQNFLYSNILETNWKQIGSEDLLATPLDLRAALRY